MALMEIDKGIVQLQQGVEGPLLTSANIYEKLKRVTEAMGLKGDKYYTDPDKPQQQLALPAPQQQEEQPDPLAEPKLKAETEIGKAQMKQDTDLQKERMRQDTELQKEEMRQTANIYPMGLVG